MKSKISRTIDRFRHHADGFFQTIRSWNERSIWWVFAIYLIVVVHVIFPIPRDLYTFENFTLLVLAQILLFSMSRADTVLGFLRHYFRYLGNYASSVSIILAALITVGLLILPRSDIPTLLQPALILFTMTVFLSLFQLDVSFRFFTPVPVRDSGVRGVLIGALWGSIFVAWYTYRFVWGSINLPYPGVTSILLWIGFFGAFAYWATDLRTEIRERLFHMGHLDRNRVLRSLRIFQITGVIAVVSGLSAFAQLWYTEYSAREAAEAAKLAAQATPAPRIPDPASEEFSPALLALIDQEKARREALSASGVTSSGAILSETLVPVGEIYPGKRYIGLGNTGDDVLWIQKLLAREGYYSGPINRTFDAATSDAFGRFLRAKTGTTASYTQLGPKTMEVFKSVQVERF